MGQILQYFSSGPPVCKNEEDLLSYAWKSGKLTLTPANKHMLAGPLSCFEVLQKYIVYTTALILNNHILISVL